MYINSVAVVLLRHFNVCKNSKFCPSLISQRRKNVASEESFLKLYRIIFPGHDSAETTVADKPEGQASTTITAEAECPEAGAVVPSHEAAGQALSVDFFKQLLSTNKERLESFCQAWEGKLEEGLPEEADGQVRSVIGMGRILTGNKGRLRQFNDLIGDCEFLRGENKTTLEDLQV